MTLISTESTMRLRQLSRKLEVNPDKIIRLLSEAGHELENDANSKLSEEQVEIIHAYFSTADEFGDPIEKTEEETQEESTEASEEEVNQEMEVPLAPPADITNQVSDSHREKAIELTETPSTGRLFKAIEDEEEDPSVEFIKAPKVELEGLKVVGKIDLPEPKQPEPKVEPEEDDQRVDFKKDKQNRRSRSNQRGNQNKGRKHRLNPVEYQRRKEERETERKKREKARKIKEKKKQHYISQVKAKPAAKKKVKKIIEEEVSSEAPILYQSKTPKSKEVKKKNPLRRFWGWLNGEYDNF